MEFLKNQEAKPKENAAKLAKKMLSLAFGTEDFEVYLKTVYKDKQLKLGLCRKMLRPNKDVGYQCLDCQKDPTCIICASCFEKSNHKGHRIFLKQNVSGMCDCGDKEAWDEKGNCCDHTGFVEEDNIIPAEQKESLSKRIKQTVYFIIQGIEVLRNGKKRKGLYELLIEIMDLMMELCGVYATLTPVVSRAFTSPISFGKETVKLYNDPAAYSTKTRVLLEPVECKASALSLLLRYSMKLND